MHPRTVFSAALLALVLVAGSVPAGAQTKTGTTVGQFMLIEPSARAAAMGNAGVSTYGEVLAAFYNPGALGHMERSGAQFTYSAWLADITYNYAAVGVRVGGASTLLLTVTALSSGEIDVRTPEQPQGTGERYTVSNLAFGLGYSRRITDRFAAGLQVKYLRETIWHSHLDAVALDFGVLYRLPFGTYLGASLSNFGTRGAYDGRDLRIRFDRDPDRFGDNSSLPAALETEEFALPVLFRVGLGIPMDVTPFSRLHLVVDAFQPSDNTESISLGAEWTFYDLLAVRGGYQHLFQQDSEFGLTFGGGLRYDLAADYGFRFDYAWAAHESLGSTHRLTVGVGF
ncbi:MAG: PorV/PorQ family protein [Rhodothermales bacterium]|nr:PorV/PorQ family protein [Rhodothermales bacterium]